MKKQASVLLLISLFFSACSAPDSITTVPDINTQVNSSANKTVKNNISSKYMDSNFMNQVASSLDLNKDGSIDVTEAPIMIGGKNVNYVYNYESNAFNDTPPTKAMPITQIVELMSQGATLSVKGSKRSEKNKDKISSSLAGILVKDSISESGKVYGYSTNIGYFTGKTTAMVRNLGASDLAKRINQQITVGKGTVNGNPYQIANGSININPYYVTIDGKYKSRLNFSDNSDFESGIQLFGSHKISDAASKIIASE